MNEQDEPSPIPSSDEYMLRIGKVTSAWSDLEYVVDNTIWALSDVDEIVGGCVTANLTSIHLKLRSLYALLDLRGASAATLKLLKSYQNRISGTAEKRNVVVHHPWGFLIPEDEEGNLEFGQMIVRADSKGRQFGPKSVPLSELDEIDSEITDKFIEFIKYRKDLASELPTFRERLLGPPSQEHDHPAP